MKTNETNAVASIDDISADNAPAIYVTGGLTKFFDAVKVEVAAEVPDVNTRKGRERIASLAAKVSKSKVAVETPGRAYLKHIKELPKVVEAELREFVNKMDELRDQTRKPLTDWQAAEDARVDKHNDGIRMIEDMAQFVEPPTSKYVEQIIDDLQLVAIDESWQEFGVAAARAKYQALATLRTMLADRKAFEEQQAENERLRAEAEARAKADHEAAIAKAAAEQASREAEQRAQAERDAAARRELELKLQAEQAELAKARAEADRKAAEQRAEQQKVESERQAQIAAELAEQERIAAVARQAAAVEEARNAELRRQAAEQAEEARQVAAREANKAHQGRINRAALQAFIAGGMTEECARQAIKLIATKKIPAISIHY